MKKFILLSVILLLLSFNINGQANQTTGVHLDGMYSGHVLSTAYNDSTKVHVLNIGATATNYDDKVLMYRFLVEETDTTNVEAVGNYSNGAQGKTAFILKPKPGEIYMVARMIISYTDDGSFDSGFYGNNIILTNGITSFFRRDGVDVYPGLDPNLPIMKNPGWAALCYDSRVDDYGQGEIQLSARFTFTATGKYILD